jgi:predicted O-methyltransferase YrrM
MIPFGEDEGVKIDVAHAHLITGLVKANKPKTVLEFGIGGGESTDAILEGLEYNQQAYKYTLVDNWYDWMPNNIKGLPDAVGECPAGVIEKYGSRIEIVTSPEQKYVFDCDKEFDFIMSDGDHHQADQWFEYVYVNLLNPGGILIYHDINVFNEPNSFPNLINIYTRCQEYGISHQLFNRNSLPTERCQRGLLAIFKEKII